MARILVIHPHRGFLEMISRILTGAYEVEVCDGYDPAIKRLSTSPAYDAVLCCLDKLGGAARVFEKASECSADARLIPIASNLAQAARFCEQWDSNVSHKQNKGDIDEAWLPERCTAGEILALFQPSAETRVLGGTNGLENVQLMPALNRGTVVDGYRFASLIGKGGFGATWLAVNETTGKRVALKVVEGEEQVNQELAALRRYVHVAERSEYLIRIEHINRDARRLWFVTPLADSLTGGDTVDSYKPLSLENRLQAVGHIAERDAVGIAICMVRALTPLHEAGLLHGDVSPSNILSCHGRWVLADPGLVRFLGEIGTCRNRTYYPQPKVDRPCHDLYAIGVLLWEMVSGIWEMSSGKERLRLEGSMLNFISRENLPTGKILRRAAAENVEQRYMTAREMLRDLETVAARLAHKSSVQDSLYTMLRPLRTGSA